MAEENKETTEKKEELKLTGQVLLDDDSMNKLRESIRKEIIQEIKENGHYTSEIKQFLNELDSKDYYNIIAQTINGIIEKTDPEKFTWSDEQLKFDKLKLMSDIILLSK